MVVPFIDDETMILVRVWRVHSINWPKGLIDQANL